MEVGDKNQDPATGLVVLLCTKSFRHSYSKRCHQQYALIAEEVAKFMGHSVDVHTDKYSDWVTESNRRRSIEFARQRRAEFANTPKATS